MSVHANHACPFNNYRAQNANSKAVALHAQEDFVTIAVRFLTGSAELKGRSLPIRPVSLNVNWRTRMRSDHRHELKTNELADWLMHFPEWAEENRNTLLAAGAIVLVALCIYLFRSFRSETSNARDQIQLTTLVSRLAGEEATAAQKPESFLGFSTTATNLKDFADHVGDREMAAFALIKRGEALRAELHYGNSPVTPDDIAKQVEQAKQCYTEALQKASNAPALAAMAQFGLGLCEEELGNIDKAKEIYHEMAKNPAYEGTAARSAAASRVKAVDDYKGAVAFAPAPAPKPTVTALPPTVNLKPVASKTPESNSVSQPKAEAPAVKPAQPAEANKPAVTTEPNRSGTK
jgi:tetratricopeptide (TPR) repeat protein